MSSIKRYTIFAGVNGAGKSTLFGVYNSEDLGVRLNTDEMVKDAGKDWKDNAAQVEAGKKLIKLQQECFDKGLSLNRETTLNGSNIVNSIIKAKELGYEIHLRYVGVNNPEIAKERVKKRIEMGGHGVSDETIERRFTGALDNLKKIYPLCDTVNIYDNSGESLELVAYVYDGKLEKTEVNCQWCDELLKELKK